MFFVMKLFLQLFKEFFECEEPEIHVHVRRLTPDQIPQVLYFNFLTDVSANCPEDHFSMELWSSPY
jgi:hypothetical protein